MSCDCSLPLPNCVVGWSAVCDCGISWSYSLTFSFALYIHVQVKLQEVFHVYLNKFEMMVKIQILIIFCNN